LWCGGALFRDGGEDDTDKFSGEGISPPGKAFPQPSRIQSSARASWQKSLVVERVAEFRALTAQPRLGRMVNSPEQVNTRHKISNTTIYHGLQLA
jgi:hypothetical protein